MRKVKSLFLIGTVFVLCLFSFVIVGADEGGYKISDYKFEGTYHKNNTVSVTETIKVQFTESRHGIYRTMPLFMEAKRDVGNGKKEVLKYQNEVKDVDVADWNYSTDIDDNYYDIKIGDRSEYVDGDQTYKISYTYVMPDDRVDTGDLIFYSVLGADWGAYIDHFSFDMKFDKAITDKEKENFKIYSGSYGKQGNDLDVKKYFKESAQSGKVNEVTGEAFDIAPRQAITLYCPVHEGYFVGAKKVSKTIPMILLIAAAILALLVLIYELFKKQKKPVQTVEFYPPEGMSSAEVGVIIDEMADDIDLISLIPWWGEKGYLTIEEVPDKKGREGKHASLLLHKVKELPADAPLYQRTLFDALFATNPRNLDDLPRSFSDSFSSAKQNLGAEFRGEKQLSTGKFKAGALLFLACAAYFGALATSSMISLKENLIFGAISAIAILALGLFRLVSYGQDKVRTKGKWITYCIALLVLAGVSIGTMFAATFDGDTFFKFPVYLGVFAVLLVDGIFIGRLVVPTDFKLQYYGKLLGLKQFIKTAEIEKLQMLIDEDPSYFFNVLPYAMVFGLSDHWAKQFKNLKVKPPTWYYGYNAMYWNAFYFNSMLLSGLRDPIQHLRTEAMMKAAASAASSGFSGGGGGGGGGGSW
ncbi:MAG: DUF2207 domain-containing protein [Eubacterium sp.]|nr:DUF2207 domain-containing protein [Eubacterium sp.]